MNSRFGVAALLVLGIAATIAHVARQIFSATGAFGGEDGLLVLYGETAAIGLGLAALRVLGRGIERPERRLASTFAHLTVVPEKKEHPTVDLEVRRAS